jgi:hypothetical protein
VSFALADLASVVGSVDGGSQRCERRKEQRTFELLVSTPRRMFASDRGARASSHWRQTGVSGHMSRGSERSARDIDQESRGGPDPDSRHAGQDRMVRRESLLEVRR